MANDSTAFSASTGHTFTLGDVWELFREEAAKDGTNPPNRSDVTDHHIIMWLKISQRNVDDIYARIKKNKTND